MYKIINYIKKNYLLLIIILIILFLIIVGFLMFRYLFVINKKVVNDNTTYQYILNDKKIFNSELNYQNNELIDIKCNNYDIYEDAFIYTKDEVILPKDMIFIDINEEGLNYVLPKYSEVLINSSFKVKGVKYFRSSYFVTDADKLFL